MGPVHGRMDSAADLISRFTDAVMVTTVAVVTGDAVTTKLADDAPSGIKTETGTATADEDRTIVT